MNRILITGGAGFIGSALAKRLVSDPENYVVIVDNLLTGSMRRLPPRTATNWKFIKADVNHFNDISAIMAAFQFDYVFHYAAVVGVQRTLHHPAMVLNDIQGIRNVLDLAKNTGVKRVFFSSSSEVYGEPVELPQNEDTTPLNSRLPYAIVKNVGESFLKSYHREYGLSYTIFRYFNTYGPEQSDDFVVSRFLHQALHGRDIIIHGDGSQSRTFLYIDDNIDASVACLYQHRFVNDVINIGHDAEVSILELAQTILQITGSSSRIVHQAPLKEGDMRRRLPDIAKMHSLLQRPLISLKEGLGKMIQAFTVGQSARS
ncbi:MAG: NAD-dependent epimerase/dehydratase family protein [Chitinophagales bacterium]|nr:NAD-dependent epimerase/dehydratase family protein [Chitinophagales bacterium]MDW8393640.1 NAD-dependent epimerase/dehydratase family protein [Chitinophagales bacterium]